MSDNWGGGWWGVSERIHKLLTGRMHESKFFFQRVWGISLLVGEERGRGIFLLCELGKFEFQDLPLPHPFP